MIFARRVGMMAVCGIGMPSGWRKSAVTANQSASAPTVAASKPAATHGEPRRAGERPDGVGGVGGGGAADGGEQRHGADVAPLRRGGPRLPLHPPP